MDGSIYWNKRESAFLKKMFIRKSMMLQTAIGLFHQCLSSISRYFADDSICNERTIDIPTTRTVLLIHISNSEIFHSTETSRFTSFTRSFNISLKKSKHQLMLVKLIQLKNIAQQHACDFSFRFR